ALLDHKLLNHRYGLSIHVPFNNQPIILSRFLDGITYPALLKSLQTSTAWLKKAPPIWDHADTQSVLKTIKLAGNLIDERAHVLNDETKTALTAYKNHEVVAIPVTSGEHATSAILFKTPSKNYLIRGDRALVGESGPMPGLLIY